MLHRMLLLSSDCGYETMSIKDDNSHHTPVGAGIGMFVLDWIDLSQSDICWELGLSQSDNPARLKQTLTRLISVKISDWLKQTLTRPPNFSDCPKSEIQLGTGSSTLTLDRHKVH